jgi:AcrR family transcriptional regulator
MEVVTVPRPTNAEIDSEILESAADLIAGRGVEGASLAQIAAAVGYSKAGLLHHFTSKQALVDAVLAAASDLVAGIGADVDALPTGPQRDIAVITALARFAIAKPGHMSLVLAAFTARPTEVELNPVLAGIATGLNTSFVGLCDDTDTERSARIIAALASIATLARHAARHAAEAGTAAARALLVTIALDALGVPASER